MLLEVADRLSLKGELEVAREIQLAMLPTGTYSAGDAEICGVTRPANTVGGDFYDVLPLIDDPEGRVIVTIGDVAGKGSPAALLMALLLAVLRTLVDEKLEARALVARLNIADLPSQSGLAVHHAVLRRLHAVDRRAHLRQRRTEPAAAAPRRRQRSSGWAAPASRSACSRSSTYEAVTTAVDHGDMLVLYSDGITEAENPAGEPFEESGLERFLAARGTDSPAVLAPAILHAVEAHARDSRFTDDLTVLILKRASVAVRPGVDPRSHRLRRPFRCLIIGLPMGFRRLRRLRVRVAVLAGAGRGAERCPAPAAGARGRRSTRLVAAHRNGRRRPVTPTRSARSRARNVRAAPLSRVRPEPDVSQGDAMRRSRSAIARRSSRRACGCSLETLDRARRRRTRRDVAGRRRAAGAIAATVGDRRRSSG